MGNIPEATILSNRFQGEVVLLPQIPMILSDSPTHSNVCNFQFICGATTRWGRGLLCPSRNTRPLASEVHEQMSRSGGQSEARPTVLSSESSFWVLIYRPTAVGMKG
ncbi:hypothetical protein TNCV_1418821 [Trichonephila clavipes]|nr:hypothetical protein TNCV_1418821 [Trichonephila clavipes]